MEKIKDKMEVNWSQNVKNNDMKCEVGIRFRVVKILSKINIEATKLSAKELKEIIEEELKENIVENIKSLIS